MSAPGSFGRPILLPAANLAHPSRVNLLSQNPSRRGKLDTTSRRARPRSDLRPRSCAPGRG
jgi:hypothetical protein